MLSLTKTSKRYTVKCGCDYFSLSFYDRGTAYHGTVRCLICGAQADLPALIEEHAGSIPKTNGVLSPSGRQIRISPRNLAGASRNRRERANLPPTKPSDCLTRYRTTLSAVVSQSQTLHRFVLFFVTVALVALAAADLRAAESPDAGAFLASLNDRAIEHLTKPGVGRDEQERRFRALLHEGFSIPTIGRFVLGRYWRVAAEEQRRAFLEVFEDVIVQRFLPIFAENSGVTLSVSQVRPIRNYANLVTVTSRMQRAHGDAVKVDWRIRRNDDKYEIVDVVVEGVSIAVTLRSEYGSFILRHGGDVRALVGHLRQQLVAGVVSPKNAENSTLQ